MAYCRYCGKKIEDYVELCPFCGGSQNIKSKPSLEKPAGQAQNEQTAKAAQSTQDTAQTAGTASGGEYGDADVGRTKVVCAVSYVSILFFLPLVIYPESKFGKFHANQALVLLIASVIWSTVFSIVGGIFGALPLIPGFVKVIISSLISVVNGVPPVAGMIFGIVKALNGKAEELPIIGSINLINK